MKITTLFSFAVIVLTLGDCAAQNINHYQCGKSLGQSKFDVAIGLGTGVFFETDTTQLDENNFDVETKESGPMLFLSLTARIGVISKFDFGGEIFATGGTTGFKMFGKYAYTDSLSKWGITLMPAIGFNFSWNQNEEDEDNFADEINIAVNSLIFEFLLPASYHPSDHVAITFGPKFYLHHNFISQTSGRSVEFHRKGARTYLSPAAFIGLHIKTIRFETTIVYVNTKVWTPYFGISVSPHDLFSLF